MLACQFKAFFEQRGHVAVIKRLVAGLADVGGDTGQIEFNPVAPGLGIDAVQISYSLILDQRGERSLGDREQILAHRLPLGIDAPISDDVQMRLDGRPELTARCRKEYRWRDEDLPGEASVNVQFVKGLLTDLHPDPDRRENSGKRRGSEQYLPE